MSSAVDTQQLWREFSGRLRAYLRPRLQSTADVDDVLQEVFLKVSAAPQNLTEIDSLSGWIYGITRNALVDHYRKNARRQRLADAVSQDAAEESPPSIPDEEQISEQARAMLRPCLEPFARQLSDHYREAILMTDLGGMSQSEAAERAGVSVSGMKSRVQRGRRLLRQALADCCEIELDARKGVSACSRRDQDCCD